MINNTIDGLIKNLWFSGYDTEQVIKVLDSKEGTMNTPRAYIRKHFDRLGQVLFDEIMEYK